MVKKIEVATKKLAKIINSKNQKEAEILKLQEDSDKLNQDIFELENEIIGLIKLHQKDIKASTRKKNIKKTTTQIEEKNTEEE